MRSGRAGLPPIGTICFSVRDDHTGRPYARSTINGRLRILSMFYRWCAADGLVILGLPWQAGVGAEPQPACGFFAHLDASGENPEGQ